MPKANPEKCPHPSDKRRSGPLYGQLQCGRCNADLTTPARTFEVRHSERVTLAPGERVRVSGSPEHGAAFTGIFLFAEAFSNGDRYLIAELQWLHDTGGKRIREGWAAQRLIHPQYVNRAPGVRDRQAREEVKV